MKQAVFKRDKLDPTATNPPRYTNVASYSVMPSRDEIDAAMAKSSFLKGKYEKILQKNTTPGEENTLNEKLKKYDMNQVATVEQCDHVFQLTIQSAAELSSIDKNYYKLLTSCFQYVETLVRRGSDTSKSNGRGDVMGVVDINSEFYDAQTSMNVETRLGSAKLELIYEAIVSNNKVVKINLPASTDENIAIRLGNSGDIFQFDISKKKVVRRTNVGIIPIINNGNYKFIDGKMMVSFEPINLFGFVWSKSVEQFVLEFKYINQSFAVVSYTGNGTGGESTYIVFKMLQQ